MSNKKENEKRRKSSDDERSKTIRENPENILERKS